MPGAQAGDQGAEIDLNEEKYQKPHGAGANSQRWGGLRYFRERRTRPLVLPSYAGPDHGGINQTGEEEMRRQAVLRYSDAIGETGSHHPPPDRTLQCAKCQDRPQAGAAVARNPAAPQKPDERHKE